MVAVNDKEPFIWRILQSNDLDEYAVRLFYSCNFRTTLNLHCLEQVMTAEGPYVPRVWTTTALGGPPPIVRFNSIMYVSRLNDVLL